MLCVEIYVRNREKGFEVFSYLVELKYFDKENKLEFKPLQKIDENFSEISYDYKCNPNFANVEAFYEDKSYKKI